jgi:hypothetical protein
MRVPDYRVDVCVVRGVNERPDVSLHADRVRFGLDRFYVGSNESESHQDRVKSLHGSSLARQYDLGSSTRLTSGVVAG